MAYKPILTSLNIYPHIHLSSFIRMFMDYLNQNVYQGDMNHMVVGNYMKALQYLQQYQDRSLDSPLLPILSGTFQLTNLEEKTNHLWRHVTHKMPYFAGARLYEPIFEDEHVRIEVVFERFVGTTELVLIAHSSAQLHDYQFLTIQWFDFNKVFKMPVFETQLLIPEKMLVYDYENDAQQISYTLDWTNTPSYQYLIRSIDQEHIVFPVRSAPFVTLTAISDGSTFYGGSEKEAFRLNMTFEWEIELPAYFVLHTDYKIKEFKPKFMLIGAVDTGIVNTVNDNNMAIAEGETIKLGDTIYENGEPTYIYEEHYNITVTEDHNDYVPWDITLPKTLTSDYKLIIVVYCGVLIEDRDYKIIDENTARISLHVDKDDIIGLYYYRKI